MLYDKPRDMDEARANLRRFSGQTHYLVGAAVLVENGEAVVALWACGAHHARFFGGSFSGCLFGASRRGHFKFGRRYQLEGLGAHLFADIDGDYFSILGLPLLPLWRPARMAGCLA